MRGGWQARWYADNWPWRLYALAWVVGGLLAPVLLSGVGTAASGDSRQLLELMKLMALGAAIGLLVALASSPWTLWPTYEARIRANGGPFSVGDDVCVLSRRHRGHVGRVYATWQQGMLRVELGDRRVREFDDLFAPIELRRIRPGEPPA